MATPVHYCSLTSSDKVNEESISGRMMGETKNNRATSFERWGFYRPQYRHVPHLISAVTLPILPYAYWYHIELSSYCSKTFGMIGARSKYYTQFYLYNQARCSYHGMFVSAICPTPDWEDKTLYHCRRCTSSGGGISRLVQLDLNGPCLASGSRINVD